MAKRRLFGVQRARAEVGRETKRDEESREERRGPQAARRRVFFVVAFCPLSRVAKGEHVARIVERRASL